MNYKQKLKGEEEKRTASQIPQFEEHHSPSSLLQLIPTGCLQDHALSKICILASQKQDSLPHQALLPSLQV